MDDSAKTPAQQQNTRLFAAAERGDASEVRHLLEDPSTDREQERPDGSGPLDVAAQNGHLDVVRVLVGANIGSLDSALEQAADKGHVEVARFLMASGASLTEVMAWDYEGAIRCPICLRRMLPGIAGCEHYIGVSDEQCEWEVDVESPFDKLVDLLVAADEGAVEQALKEAPKSVKEVMESALGEDRLFWWDDRIEEIPWDRTAMPEGSGAYCFHPEPGFLGEVLAQIQSSLDWVRARPDLVTNNEEPA